MVKLLFSIVFILSLTLQANALEISAPEVPVSGKHIMPENTESFGDALLTMADNALSRLYPELREAMSTAATIVSTALLISALRIFSGNLESLTDFIGIVIISGILLSSANTMIQLGSRTVFELSSYGKLLTPVMASAAAAQGQVASSAAIYMGTAFFDAILGNLISNLLLPLLHMFLTLAVASCAIGEEFLKKICTMLKNCISWCLKTLLIIFTTYLSVTGVVSGTTDAAALKAAKVTFSTVVPVVGGILSDASEAVLVSAGVLKNAAGVYGILAAIAVILEPFLKIGAQYLILKFTSAICSLVGTKRITELTEHISSAMGLLLAMTGAECVLLLISTFCFMKGIG